MKRKLSIALIMLTMFMSTINTYAANVGCTSTKKQECVKIGVDKDGKDIMKCEDIFDTKCVDRVMSMIWMVK